MGFVSTSQFAFSTGAQSPSACTAATFTDNSGTSPTTHDAGAGNIITAVCIKTGLGGTPPSFANGLDHSNPIVAGPVVVGVDNPAGCFSVSAIPAQVVTVTDTGNAGCMAQSHIDFIFDGVVVGGELISLDTTMVLLGATKTTASWMIPVLVSAIGIGIVIARKF